MKAGVICGVRVSHKSASVREIEMAGADEATAVIETLLTREGISEAFAIQTCNRSEAYVVAESVTTARDALTNFAPEVRDGAVCEMNHEESLRHLMRVAAGLESLVIGEDQILGQFRQAIKDAQAVGGLGSVLEAGLMKALRVGKRAREETAINEGVTSIGSAAVELLHRETRVSSATALVVGAGEIGTLVANAFSATDIEHLIIANRTTEHAKALARTVSVSAEGVGLETLSAVLGQASLVVAATESDEFLIKREDLCRVAETFIIDLGQPRDVEPLTEDIVGVSVRNMDDLESVTAETEVARRSAAEDVEQMIETEFQRLLADYKRQRADDAIQAMYQAAEQVKDREYERAVAKLETQEPLTEKQKSIINDMAEALVGQLLAAPTKSLRDAAVEDDWSTIQTAMTLFNPEFESTGPTFDYPQAGPRASEEADTGGKHIDEPFAQNISEPPSDG